jgi:small nuclear ribonucleoprotein (snRNP)-like protein
LFIIKNICRIAFVALLTLIGSLNLVLGQTKDTIVFYNGQILVGDIRTGQFGEITINDVDLKLLQVKQHKIKTLTTDNRFRIETNDKREYIGKLEKANKDGWVNIILDEGDTLLVQIIDIGQIISIEKKFLEGLNGSLTAGFSYNKSSDIGQTNLSSTVHYATNKFDYALSVSMNGSIDSSKYSRDREDVGLFVARSLGPSWFAAAAFYYQRNLELSIARRYQQLIGGGNKIFVRQNWVLLLNSGLAFNEEKSTAGIASGLLLEIPIGIRFNFFKYRSPNLQISSTQTAYFSLSQSGRIRLSSSTSFSWELIKNFRLNINPYANYDNQPPEGNSNFDYGISFGLSFTF